MIGQIGMPWVLRTYTSLFLILAWLEVSAGEPLLPIGLSGIGEARKHDAATPIPAPSRSSYLSNVSLAGFVEGRAGIRTQNDPEQDQPTIGETRLQLRLEYPGDRIILKLTTDFLLDAAQDQRQHGLSQVEKEGYVDLREASVATRLNGYADLKVGRQVLTWGTGDLIFINDLFAKDWVSFLIGRDVEYLKAPSTSVKLSLFTNLADLDLVYTPRFESDRYLTGERLSFFNPLENRVVGKNDVLDTDTPGDWFSDDEIALRLYRDLYGFQLALYGYRGFWKSPGGFDLDTSDAIFPELSVYGASIEGALINGIFNIEFGYYDSRDDRDGDDPGVRNSELRFLTGYRQELTRDLTLGVQYYLERMQNYGAYRNNLPSGSETQDQNRHVLTSRLTKMALNQNLRLSLFGYYSPSDNDGYLRPIANYAVDDNWALECGGNWFFGANDHTFFGQFEDNTNVYVAVRYSFAPES